MSYESHGVTYGIRTSDESVFVRIAELLPPDVRPAPGAGVSRLYSLVVGGAPRPGVREFNVLYVDSLRAGRTLNLDELLLKIESDSHLFVAEHAPDRIFVHAGAVGWNGRAILIPGESYSGKSTLVSALLEAGATYYSDEFALLDHDGRVYPFARPIALRAEDDLSPAQKMRAEELGADVGSAPLPVGAVLMTRYEAGSQWAPSVASPGQAVLRLLENTVPARKRPADALATLRRAVSGAQLFRGTRGEAAELAPILLDELDSKPANADAAEVRGLI